MSTWLSEREQRLVAGAETASAAMPIPTQIVSNGEYLPPPQSATQKKVEARINELADLNGKQLGLSRRQFLHTSCGMAAAFLAMNDIYGNVFQVAPAEAREPELMLVRAQGLAGQFIFDVQTHFVRDDFDHKELLDLAGFASQHWNPKMKEEGVSSLARYKFQNYVKEIYYDSDTNMPLLSGAPIDDPSWWLLPPDYEKSFAGVWEYATAWDIGKAAKDWPQMNFVIYHSALRPFLELPDQAWAEFASTGRIHWATDLAEIPQKFGVTNVYAELGTSFANSAVAHPKFCAALVGTLIKGMGVDHVMWGTDSVWYGSPQWQIEALRRLEIPQDMQKKHGFAPLGDANSATKQLIFGRNATKFYKIRLRAADNARIPAFSEDRLAALKNAYELAAKEPSNLRYGYVRAA